MSKEFKFGSVIFTFILIFLIINMSFAWYTAKVNQGIIDELFSEGIDLKINTTEVNTLTPDILKEGVLTIEGGNYVLPTDYDSRKQNGDSYYVESFGNVIELVSTVELYLYESDTIKLEFTAISNNGEETNITKYLNITYSLVASGSAKSEMVVPTNNIDTMESTVGNLVEGTYDLYINISYSMVNEMLPEEVLNGGVITLTVKGTLE